MLEVACLRGEWINEAVVASSFSFIVIEISFIVKKGTVAG
jgi:hypothetical protein